MNVREKIDALKRAFPEGTEIVLLKMNYPLSPPPMTVGKVRKVDDIGNIHTVWDTGSTRPVILGQDDILVRRGDRCIAIVSDEASIIYGGWDFPLDEIQYLLDEHNREVFCFYNWRLHETNLGISE